MNATEMKSTPDVENTVKEAVKRERESQGIIRKHFWSVLYKTPFLEDDRFWELLEELKQECMNKQDTELYGCMGRFEHGASSFAWEFAYGKHEGKIDELLSFVQTYENKKTLVGRALNKVVEGLSDDSYGDFCDSFLMHGRETFEAALEGRLLKPQKELTLGENYIHLRLEEAAQSYWASLCLRKDEE